MGTLIGMALSLIIAIIVAVAATIIGLFVGQIIFVESVGISIAAGCLANYFLHIHPALCLIIGIGVFLLLFPLMNRKFGFWIIGGFMSLLWGLLVAAFVYEETGKDMIWTFVSWGLASIVVLALHLNAKRKNTSI